MSYYGIQCNNISTGELTLSSEAYTFGYLGKATLYQLNHYSSDTLSSQAGYTVWTFTSSGPIIAALGVGSSDGPGRITDIIKVDSTTWHIFVEQYTSSTEGPTGTAAATYGVPSSTSNVYVFGLPTTLPAYGVALYNSAGLLTGDMSKIPLQVAAKVSLDTSTSTVTGLPSLTKPAIVGFPNCQRFDSVNHGSYHINTTYVGLWGYSSGSLARGMVLYSTEQDDAGTTPRTILTATNGMVIEANGLT